MTTRRRQVAIKKTVDVSRVIVGTEDMVLLQNLTEDGVVANIAQRLQAEQIYTNIGHVLVAMNPYKWLNIYDDESIKKYVHQQRVDVAPHIFATAEAAFRAMILEEENQCVIISGESGAGKTEASKQIQSYIAKVCGGGESVDKIKNTFLESNPVLEAFGNAKTLRNNNSSRFGKYFELKFNRFGTPLGGVVTNYLLEKSRIVRPGTGERNFHIFYQLIASEYAAALRLNFPPESFEYLACSGVYRIDGVDDKDEVKVTIAAMRSVGLSNKVIQSVFSLLAAVLHLGNLKFVSKQIDGVEGSVIKPSDSLNSFCDLAKVSPENLVQALTYRELQTMAAGGQSVTYQVPQNPIQAAARRDTIAKSIYSNLFDLIVARINTALDVSNVSSAGEDMLSIGVLDIYGFEVFKNNGFEQLCINYVNEKLQQIFIELTLRAEQEEYERESITWKPIPFFNNQIVCTLLDGSKPSGLFRILDDTCKTMHGTKEGIDIDKKFVETCSQVHSSHAHFQSNSAGFIIKHYAGDVTYNVGKLGESNKDSLNKDLLIVVKSSKDQLLAHLFAAETLDPNDKKSTSTTASTRIRSQCAALVTALMDCAPHYVRCIKSNDEKRAVSVDNTRVKHQVKYLGLVENIKVRRAGYAYRAEYHRFLDRFGMLCPQTFPEYRGVDKEGCKLILNHVTKSKLLSLSKEEVQLGKSKVFIRQPETYFGLERLLEVKRGDYAVKIQTAWRKHASQREYILLFNQIARLYLQNGKSRRRDSIFRPFIADYLCELDPSVVETVREGLFRIIDHFDPTENIIFADASCGSLRAKQNPRGSFDIGKVLLIVTSMAIYVCVINVPKSAAVGSSEASCWQAAVSENPMKPPPPVCLLRRITIGGVKPDTHKRQLCQLQGISLSKFADEVVCIKVKQSTPLPLPTNTHWVPDRDQDVCFATKAPFTFFSRRHHCRLCGNVFSDKACDNMVPIPDLGYYTPVRMCDACVGLESIDGAEDLILLCPRRSEFVAIVQSAWSKCGLSQDLRSVDLPITFKNLCKIESSCPSGISRILGDEIQFTEVDTRIPLNPAGNFVAGYGISVSIEGRKIVISSAPGLSHDVVEKKQRAQAARQQRKAERRRRDEAERRERQAIREETIERERMERLAVKRAAKAAEKERKLAASESAASTVGGGASSKQLTPKMVSSTGGGVSSKQGGAGGSMGSELAAKMAKLRAKAED